MLGFCNHAPLAIPRPCAVLNPAEESLLLLAGIPLVLGFFQQIGSERGSTRIARQSYDIVDIVAFAPLQHPPSAKARIRPPDDAHLGPGLP